MRNAHPHELKPKLNACAFLHTPQISTHGLMGMANEFLENSFAGNPKIKWDFFHLERLRNEIVRPWRL